jgi:hypothetical protein
MAYLIKSIEYHKAAIAAAEADTKRIKSDPCWENSESGLSLWSNSTMRDYHSKAIAALEAGAKLGIEGPAGDVFVLVDADGNIVADKTYGKSFNGHMSYSWYLYPAAAEKFGRKYMPKGSKSKIQKSLGLKEEWKMVPVKSYFDAHCAYVGAPVWFSLVPSL